MLSVYLQVVLTPSMEMRGTSALVRRLTDILLKIPSNILKRATYNIMSDDYGPR